MSHPEEFLEANSTAPQKSKAGSNLGEDLKSRTTEPTALQRMPGRWSKGSKRQSVDEQVSSSRRAERMLDKRRMAPRLKTFFGYKTPVPTLARSAGAQEAFSMSST